MPTARHLQRSRDDVRVGEAAISMRRSTSFSDSRALLWMFPLSYLAHIAEEYWAAGGYPAYLNQVLGVQLSPGRFLALQTAGLVLMCLGIMLARWLGFRRQMMVILASVVLTNALTHTIRSILGVRYEPGLVTSLLIWVPLGSVTLFQLYGRMSAARYFVGAALGILICVVVELITMFG